MIAVASFVGGCLLSDVSKTRWVRTADECPPRAAAGPWATATPAAVGLAEQPLDELARSVERGELGNVHAILVVRDGRLVFERYFRGRDASWGTPLGEVVFAPETLHDLRSVTKSIVGAMVGIALGDGTIPGLEATLVDLLPSYRDRMAPAVQRIRLRDALTMSAGLEWDELSRPYWWPWNDETAMWRSDDPVGFALSRPVVAEPGTTFAYNGGMPVVLAAIVERASGMPIDRFAARRLFCPLGVQTFEWMRHSSGLHVAASGLRLRPRDMARFGWMMLQNGRADGRQVVPEAYVRESLAVQLETHNPIAPVYGYQWWITRPANAEVPVAIGNGGQRIFLLREAHTVLVVTAGNYDAANQGDAPRHILDAVLAATAAPTR